MAEPAHLELSADLARRVRAARVLSDKKARELADDLGWSVQKLYRFEGGAQVPDALELRAIATATGQPLDFFFGGDSSLSRRGEMTLPPPLPLVKVDDEADAA